MGNFDETNAKSELRSGSDPRGQIKLVLGIGNELKGDDAVGLLVAKLVDGEPGWIGIDGGIVPENFIGKIRRIQPRTLILVDAAEMGIDPGEFRLIDFDRAETLFTSTHSIPFSFLVQQLKSCAGEVLFVGIQASSYEFGAEITELVKRGAERLAHELITGVFP